jgi:Uma2 family endonuclease
MTLRLDRPTDELLEFEDIDHTPTGSMTLENELENVRREADLSYELAGNPETRSLNIPDLAIEIVVTSGGLNKLAAYQKLQIPEVWFWQTDRISIHFLKDDRSGFVSSQPTHQSTNAKSQNVGVVDERLPSPPHHPKRPTR